MDKARSFEIHGAPKLPIGYRFRPTDEELVVHYLKKKALSLPLPASIIPELDVLQIDPLLLPVGDLREKRYFFYKKKKDENVKRFGGYWKPVGKGRVIMASDNPNQTVGIRRTMAFCQRNSNNKTRWLLHEYHLARSGPTPNSLHLISPVEGNEYWVVCGILQKKRRPGNRKEKKKISLVVTNNNNKPCSCDVIVEDLSDSSIITDDDDDKEHNSVNSNAD